MMRRRLWYDMGTGKKESGEGGELGEELAQEELTF